MLSRTASQCARSAITGAALAGVAVLFPPGIIGMGLCLVVGPQVRRLVDSAFGEGAYKQVVASMQAVEDTLVLTNQGLLIASQGAQESLSVQGSVLDEMAALSSGLLQGMGICRGGQDMEPAIESRHYSLNKKYSSGRPVNLADINLDILEDARLAGTISEDCIRLLREKGDFEKVKNQEWYRRIWATLSGSNTRKLSSDISSVRQAQARLVEILQVHSRSNARSNSLVLLMAKGLRAVDARSNKLIEVVFLLADRIALIEKELELHRRQLSFCPSNEYTWNQEQRLLLWKLMVAAAHADGHVSEAENVILDHKLADLDLSEDYLDEAIEFRRKPHNIDGELERIDSYRVRLVMYRHGVGMLHADARMDSLEHMAMKHLSRVLHIRKQDEDAVINEFFMLPASYNTNAILSSLSGSGRRSVSAPDNRDVQAVSVSIEQLRLRNVGLDLERERLAARIVELYPSWVCGISERIAYGIIAPVIDVFEVYGESSPNSVSEMVSIFSLDNLVDEVNSAITTAEQLYDRALGLICDFSVLPASITEQDDACWEHVVGQDHGWESAMADLLEAGELVTESEPSVLGSAVKGGALGYAGAFILGPVGIVGAVATSYFSGKKDAEKFEKSVEIWDDAVSRFAEATDSWAESAEQTLIEHFSNLFRYLSGEGKNEQSLSGLTGIVSLLEAEL